MALRHTSLSATISRSFSPSLTQEEREERRGGRREDEREGGAKEMAGSSREMREARWAASWRGREEREREGREKKWRDRTG